MFHGRLFWEASYNKLCTRIISTKKQISLYSGSKKQLEAVAMNSDEKAVTLKRQKTDICLDVAVSGPGMNKLEPSLLGRLKNASHTSMLAAIFKG